jgi:K+-sensing histidine kinase KdpD
MKKDVDEMTRMLEAYLAFARGDSGEPSAPADMAALLDELKAEVERYGGVARADFHGYAIVTVRLAAFKRCLANLVSNAARFASTIALTGHRDHRWLTITVDDDGPGIPAPMREEVFKPFLPSTWHATRTRAAAPARSCDCTRHRALARRRRHAPDCRSGFQATASRAARSRLSAIRYRV